MTYTITFDGRIIVHISKDINLSFDTEQQLHNFIWELKKVASLVWLEKFEENTRSDETHNVS